MDVMHAQNAGDASPLIIALSRQKFCAFPSQMAQVHGNYTLFHRTSAGVPHTGVQMRHSPWPNLQRASGNGIGSGGEQGSIQFRWEKGYVREQERKGDLAEFGFSLQSSDECVLDPAALYPPV